MIVFRRYFTVKMFASKNRKNARQYDHALNNLSNIAKKDSYSIPKTNEITLPVGSSNPYTITSPSSNNVIDFSQARSEYRLVNAKKINNPEYNLTSTSTPGGYVGGGNTVNGGSYTSTGTSLPSIGKNDSFTGGGNNLQYSGNQTQSPVMKKGNSTVGNGDVSYVLPKTVEEKPLTYKANVSSPPSSTVNPSTSQTTTGGGSGGSSTTSQTTTGGGSGGSSTTKPNNNNTKPTNIKSTTGGVWKGVGIGAGITAAGLLAYNHFKNKDK